MALIAFHPFILIYASHLVTIQMDTSTSSANGDLIPKPFYVCLFVFSLFHFGRVETTLYWHWLKVTIFLLDHSYDSYHLLSIYWYLWMVILSQSTMDIYYCHRLLNLVLFVCVPCPLIWKGLPNGFGHWLKFGQILYQSLWIYM